MDISVENKGRDGSEVRWSADMNVPSDIDVTGNVEHWLKEII